MNCHSIDQDKSLLLTQARASSNVGKYGFDSHVPKTNAFTSPVWGRSQKTPDEDLFVITENAYKCITGMQRGSEPEYLDIIATAKHFAEYDLKNYNNVSRLGHDAMITRQDLAKFYVPPILTAARDTKVNSVRCSYNAVNGVPSYAGSSCRHFFGIRGSLIQPKATSPPTVTQHTTSITLTCTPRTNR